MNEAVLAAAIRDRLAPSPSRFGASTYFALRISGVGIAERPALREVCYRCPQVWTSPEMLARAAGLPVIAGHPAGALNSEEYVARNVGSVVLPYVAGSELWGIARICDDDAATAMATGELSTSPMITLAPDASVTLEGENRLIIEGDPATLDHLAIVPRGVWDKGGMPSGIRLDTLQKEYADMADEKEKGAGTESADKEREREKADSENQEDPLQKVMASLGGIGDALTSLGKRLDKLETDIQTRADADVVRVNGNTSDSDRNRLDSERAKAQIRADEVAQAWGQQAPKPWVNEDPFGYERRLVAQFQCHSPRMKDVDVHAIRDAKTLGAIRDVVYADAVDAAKSPQYSDGQLIKRTRQLPTGHMMTEYYGDIHAEMAPFRIPPRLATLIPINRGA